MSSENMLTKQQTLPNTITITDKREIKVVLALRKALSFYHSEMSVKLMKAKIKSLWVTEKEDLDDVSL